MSRRQHLWAAIVLVPALISTGLFVYGFIAWTGYASLTDWNTIRRVNGFLPPAPYLGIDNYEAVFATPRFWTNDVFANLVFTVVFVAGCILVGLLLAVLIDQHMTSPDAIYVDFFGRPASTTSTLAALALRTGAPVIPLFAFPLPGGRYRMIYEHPVEPPSSEGPEAVREFTQRCTDVLEMHVRRHPELWLWMHRRWRDAPGPALDAAPGMFPSAKADLETDT